MVSERPEVPGKASLLARGVAVLVDCAVLALLQNAEWHGYWFGLLFVLSRDGFMGGRSPGKKLLGLRTVRRGGEDPAEAGIRESVLRNVPLGLAYLALAVPYLGWLVGMGLVAAEALLVVGSPDGARLGDELGRTLVMEER